MPLSDILVINQSIFDRYVKKESRKKAPFKAENYISQFRFQGRDIAYMSEVDPHVDMPVCSSEKTWKVRFHAVHKDFVFIYRFQGKLHIEQVVDDRIYEFDYLKLHGFIHKERIDSFRNKKFWENDWVCDKQVKVIFEFV